MAFDYQMCFLASHSVFSDKMKERIREEVKNNETITIEHNEQDLGPEGIISYTARVSNPSNQTNFDTANGLLRSCINKAHWSVFEQADASIEIITTRDIGRQILRHRSFHFQEFSQRYANPDKELGFVNREARLQDTKNRQNSIDTADANIISQWATMQTRVMHEAMIAYKDALKLGIAKEQARAVLPEGLTLSRMYMKGTLRDWYHYCRLRQANGTQKEHQDIANKVWFELVEVYPFLKEC